MLILLVSTDGSWIPAAGFEAESATDGRELLSVWRGQASEIALNCAAGCDPCDALVDVAAGWRRSEEVGFFVGYPPGGSVAERSIDSGIPSNATIMFGGSFSEGVGDPFGWLVGDGCEPVAVSVVGFIVQV